MQPTHHRVVIVGGGFSGLGVAIRLLAEGIRDFVLLEKAEQLGGTWRENTYPGCACDVPSQLYSFSFAPSNDWSRVFAEQPEIQRYLLRVADEHGVMPYVRLRCEVGAIRWDDAAQRWQIETNQGPMSAAVVVAGLGPLHVPRLPSIPGIDRFEGTIFHSARWRHDISLRGRRVAVIGTGSSAIQFVPEIQPELAHLVLFQRTAPWVLPKPDHAIPAIEKAAFRHLPGFRKTYRSTIYGLLELLQLAERKPAVMQQLQKVGLMHLRRQVRDPELRRMLTPDFTLGCKRLLLSNSYYPALQRPNVEVVGCAMTEVRERSVIGADGREHEVDTIICGTGFHVTDSPAAKHVFGREGRSMSEVWQGSPQAYLGTSIAGFPNFFFMIGPNLGNGHSSALVLIEAQAKYIADALHTMERDRLTSIEVKADVQDRYNRSVQAALAGTVWNAGGCASYYLDANGRNSTIYPWTTIDLRRRLRRFDVEHYALRAQPASTASRSRGPSPIDLCGAVVAITGGARGIGLATAKRFVEAGARVCIGDLDLAAAREAAAEFGQPEHAYALDVSDPDSFARFVATIEAEVGPIDVLVNNAGVMPTGRFLDEADAVENAAMAVNHRGTSLGMKLVLPRMIGRGRGHVVNVASLAGKVRVAGLASYVASKHAAVGLSAAVREEIAGTGVTLSTVMPGAVRTRLSEGIPLQGILAIDPDDVARVVVESCRTRASEIVVPGFLAAYPVIEALVPESLIRLARRAIRADRVLTHTDVDVRADYEAAVRTQPSARR
jgi:cation diffusion facilitator CzcD-associated flavoprotein CzcO/NAD(P)-dependent dehydrogenase (short-subunit alcohol dehydrogenase family)